MKVTPIKVRDLLAILDKMPRVDVAFTVNIVDEQETPPTDAQANAILIEELRLALQEWMSK